MPLRPQSAAANATPKVPTYRWLCAPTHCHHLHCLAPLRCLTQSDSGASRHMLCGLYHTCRRTFIFFSLMTDRFLPSCACFRVLARFLAPILLASSCRPCPLSRNVSPSPPHHLPACRPRPAPPLKLCTSCQSHLSECASADTPSLHVRFCTSSPAGSTDHRNIVAALF